MATWQHLRSSTANKRPTTSLADGRIAINTNTASPGLFFKDSAGTGIVKVGPVHVGTTAPNSVPASGGSSGNYTGEQWLDTSVSPAQMKVWNGSTWVGIVADELPVSKLQDGAARQLIQTDAAGTGVEWTSNVDVPGTLDVTSTATFDSIAQYPLGSAAAPTLTFTGDNNTGIYSPGADQVAISTNGTQRLVIDSSGNINIDSNTLYVDATNNRVGLGTSSPSQLLTTVGNIKIAGAQASDNAKLCLTRTDRSWSINNETDLRFYNGSGDTDSPPTASVVFSSLGNVGIGTTSVSSRLHVLNPSGGAGTTEVSTIERDNTGYFFKLYRNAGSGNAGGLIGADSAGTYYTGGHNTQNMLYIDGGNAVMQFYTNNLERGRWDSSGRFLVGTSSASDASKFVVQGQVGANAGQMSIRRNAAGADAQTLGTLSFDDSSGNEGARIQAIGDAAWTSGSDHPTRLVFSTTADGASSPTERMRIPSSGGLLLNTTSRINDGLATIGFQGSIQKGLVLNDTDPANTRQFIGFHISGTTQIGFIANSNNTGVTYSTASDYRLKENVVPLTGAVDRLNQLQVHRFNFIADPDTTVDGFIAHEAQAVVPECVTGTKDEVDEEGNPVYQGIDQSKLVPLLTAALQEALAEIESLKARVTALEP
jgi:hypothetical protein